MIGETNKLFQNKHILVLGLAKSGLAVAKLLLRYGAHVQVNERSPREECQGVEELEELGVPVICGGHPFELLDQPLNMIVKNPGIPYDIPFLVEAERKGITVITEVEIASLISRAPIIGITGSNGKTTTTTLIYRMLEQSKRSPLIAGNIGTVMCEVAEQAKENEIIVAELSSFQLLGTREFTPHIALLLNVYDAHLNYHHTREHYIQAKLKLFANQTEGDLAVLNADQAEMRHIATTMKARVAWFSTQREVEQGAFVRAGQIIYRDQEQQEVEVLPLSALILPGEHNLQNVLAAVVVAFEAGADLASIQEVLCTFEGVEHRLKFVADIAGVRYFNDSKATNATATLSSIKAFSGDLILIAGGLERGEDLTVLHDIFSTHLKGIVVYGELAKRLAEVARQAGVKHIEMVDTVTDAVNSASRLAEQGDIVLLSPAAASWDQFKSFEERGDMFIQSVHKLR